jgi:hypothetical protein
MLFESRNVAPSPTGNDERSDPIEVELFSGFHVISLDVIPQDRQPFAG